MTLNSSSTRGDDVKNKGSDIGEVDARGVERELLRDMDGILPAIALGCGMQAPLSTYERAVMGGGTVGTGPAGASDEGISAGVAKTGGSCTDGNAAKGADVAA